MTCNLCSSETNKIISTKARLETHNIIQCPECGLVYIDLQKTNEELELWHRTEYRKNPALHIQTAEQHYNDQVTRKDVKSQFEYISKNISIIGKRILEIGSASGGLLELLNNNGARASGLEINNEYRRYCQNKGLDVSDTPVELHKQKYDLIIAFHVLEHFTNPMKSIRGIFTCLKSSGAFMGEVPNQNEWGLSIFNSEIIKQLHYNPHVHYFYFTTSTLNKYFEKTGFREMRFETVERYNSLAQLRIILGGGDISKILIPEVTEEDLRLRIGGREEQEFNRVFSKAVNMELKGDCLRFIARIDAHETHPTKGL